MKGIPNNPVVCIECGDPHGYPKDHLCARCRMKKRFPKRRFPWTPTLDEMLRSGYQRAKTHRQKSVAIDNVMRASNFPRSIVKVHAQELGLTHDTRHPWSAADREQLRELAGRLSTRGIAKRLHRAHAAVRAQLESLHISYRITTGYTREDLQQLLGVSWRQVNLWIQNDWLRPLGDRIPEKYVEKFLRLHADQYDLRRVDQAWFKGLIFPDYGTP